MSRYFVFDNQVDYNEQLHCLSIAYMYKQKVQHLKITVSSVVLNNFPGS